VNRIVLIALGVLLAGCGPSREALLKTSDRCLVRGDWWSQIEVVDNKVYRFRSSEEPAVIMESDGRIFAPAEQGTTPVGYFRGGQVVLTWPKELDSNPIEGGSLTFAHPVGIGYPVEFIYSEGCSPAQAGLGVAAYNLIESIEQSAQQAEYDYEEQQKMFDHN